MVIFRLLEAAPPMPYPIMVLISDMAIRENVLSKKLKCVFVFQIEHYHSRR